MKKVIDTKEDFRDWHEMMVHKNSVAVSKEIKGSLNNYWPNYNPYNVYDKNKDYYKWYYSKSNDFGF